MIPDVSLFLRHKNLPQLFYQHTAASHTDLTDLVCDLFTYPFL